MSHEWQRILTDLFSLECMLVNRAALWKKVFKRLCHNPLIGLYLAWIIIAVGQQKRLVVLFFCTFEQYCTVDEKCMFSAVKMWSIAKCTVEEVALSKCGVLPSYPLKRPFHHISVSVNCQFQNLIMDVLAGWKHIAVFDFMNYAKEI